MTGGGFAPRGALFAPGDAIDEEPVVFRYAHRFLRRIERLRAGGSWSIADGLDLECPLLHDHGVETYGYRLSWNGLSLGHVVDTFWMDALPEAYAGVDLLLVNTTRLQGGDRRLLHLGADDAERLIAAVRPRSAVLTHFGMQLVRAGPDRIALEIPNGRGSRPSPRGTARRCPSGRSSTRSSDDLGPDTTAGAGSGGHLVTVAHLVSASVLAASDETTSLRTVRLSLSRDAARAHERPGQVVKLHVPGGDAYFAVASAPSADGTLDLLLKRGGKVSDAAIVAAVPGATLQVTPPFGKGFPVAEAHGQHVLLFAAGSGIAPIRSVVQHVLAHRDAFDRVTPLLWPASRR